MPSYHENYIPQKIHPTSKTALFAPFSVDFAIFGAQAAGAAVASKLGIDSSSTSETSETIADPAIATLELCHQQSQPQPQQQQQQQHSSAENASSTLGTALELMDLINPSIMHNATSSNQHLFSSAPTMVRSPSPFTSALTSSLLNASAASRTATSPDDSGSTSESNTEPSANLGSTTATATAVAVTSVPSVSGQETPIVEKAERPSLSYKDLIIEAIESSPEKRLKLNEIYQVGRPVFTNFDTFL
ncbi:unnamed protein product [Anisakis simplex]|uniref:Fork-head domain-containing protein n=1 Tax=Anisakis simplex TaxID=6269 RepID=A0A3P6QZF8_ANISI|nr:unnamed protein product [Anisakis simplex]